MAAKISYLHNALGQRVFKSEPQVAQTAPNAMTLGTPFVNWLVKNFGWMFAAAQVNATLGQSYVYDDGQLSNTPMLLGEYGNGSSQTLGRSEYLWLPLDDGTTMPIGLYTNSRFYAIHADHLNTPRQITDDANKVAWQWPYSAFGDNKPSGILQASANVTVPNAMLFKATPPAVTFNLRFPGQYFDEESNLNYNYLRSYQPTQGRYTQADPISLDGGWNRFSYAESNALMHIDPLGLTTAVCIAKGSSGVGYSGGKEICEYSCTANGRTFDTTGGCNTLQNESICYGIPITGNTTNSQGQIRIHTGDLTKFNVDTGSLIQRYLTYDLKFIDSIDSKSGSRR